MLGETGEIHEFVAILIKTALMSSWRKSLQARGTDPLDASGRKEPILSGLFQWHCSMCRHTEEGKSQRLLLGEM